jgi:hypothetical protein
MTKNLKAALAVLLTVSSALMQAQTAPTPTRTTARKTTARKKAPAESALERQLRELREQMASQQNQINELKQQLADRDARLSNAASEAQSASTAAAAAQQQTQSLSTSLQANTDAVSTLNASVTDLKATSAGLAQTVSDAKRDINTAIESPTAMRYKGIQITPVGFFAFETVYRQRSLNSDVNTAFNSTPFGGAGQSNTSELNFSARQSRIGGLFEGNTGPFKLSGYVEADFLSAGATSNENQSNSYTLRQRQVWGQAATNNGFILTGGQMWSLVTETKKSTDNRTENLPMTVDSNYHVGFSWARQPAIRFQKKSGPFTLAGALEEAEYIYSATNANPNFFIGNAGAGGGLYNTLANYSNNVAPDIVIKGTDDAKVGHYEFGGLIRFYRSRYYPNLIVTSTGTSGTTAGAANDTRAAGGIFANARVPVSHYLDVGAHFLGGWGVGRYGTSTLPDITARPDGTLAPLKAGQGLLSLEGHPTPKLDIFGYAGAEYAQRTVYLNTNGTNAGKLTGYAPPTASNAGCGIELPPTSTGNGFAGGAPYNPGTPANCLGATRVVIQGTAGFTYRVYNSPRYGRLQYQVQYSYLTRNAWVGVGGAPHGVNNMVFTSMRYYIP